MLPFIFSIIGWFLITFLIFKNNIKNNVFNVVLIIMVGTLISCTLVNGMVGMKYPIHTFLYDQKDLYLLKNNINFENVEDSLIFDKFYGKEVSSFISYNFEDNYLQARKNIFYTWNNIEILFYDYEDTTKVSHMDIFKDTYNIPKNNLWVNSNGIPNFNKKFILHIPNDSIHIAYNEYAKKHLDN